MRRKRAILYLLILVAVSGGLFIWYENLGKFSVTFPNPDSAEQSKQLIDPSIDNPRLSSSSDLTETLGAQPPTIKKISIPKQSDFPKVNGAPELQSSPSLPKVALESSQSERRNAYGLKNSVDFIVRPDEPFEIHGRKLTVDEILKRLNAKQEQGAMLPNIQELNLGSALKKPIKSQFIPAANAAAYYAVRVVLPGENLWNIHYAIIQEYLARRHIALAARSDEPFPDGQSSGIGRLLKFIEGVVYVYDINHNRIEQNLNLIHPQEIIVFFKISDLFAALDRLQPADFQNLRYVKNCLRLEHSGQCSDLLDRQALAK